MLNLAIGTAQDLAGKACILTHPGMHGHAVYGPYEQLEAGRYMVEFNLAAVGDVPPGDEVVAVVDVVADSGRAVLAREEISLSRLATGPLSIRLPFLNAAPRSCEFRVETTGRVPLLVEDYCRRVRLEAADADEAALFERTSFPGVEAGQAAPFFAEHAPSLRRLHEQGALVTVTGAEVVVTIDGVAFHARVIDDLRFVAEIFFRSSYNFSHPRECCVVDIGTNIGLVALTFARKPEVREVHTFEPFAATYDRAQANFALNPGIAAKISSHNFGLAGADEDTTILLGDTSDSGALSIRGAAEGAPVSIAVRDAAGVLGPIIAAAEAAGRAVIAKVDCEGSEFPIFETLAAHGLLGSISAFMVEWHRGIGGKTQQDLLAPLLALGFTVFDQSGRTGNGFFYAVRG